MHTQLRTHDTNTKTKKLPGSVYFPQNSDRKTNKILQILAILFAQLAIEEDPTLTPQVYVRADANNFAKRIITDVGMLVTYAHTAETLRELWKGSAP